MTARIAHGKKQAKAMTKKGLLTSEQAEDVLHLLGQREVRTLGEITIALSHLDEYMRIQQLTGCYDLGALATGQHCTLWCSNWL